MLPSSIVGGTRRARAGRPAAGEAKASHPAARRRKEVSDDDATLMRMRRIMVMALSYGSRRGDEK